LDSTPESYIISIGCTRPASLRELSGLARLGWGYLEPVWHLGMDFR